MNLDFLWLSRRVRRLRIFSSTFFSVIWSKTSLYWDEAKGVSFLIVADEGLRTYPMSSTARTPSAVFLSAHSWIYFKRVSQYQLKVPLEVAWRFHRADCLRRNTIDQHSPDKTYDTWDRTLQINYCLSKYIQCTFHCQSKIHIRGKPLSGK